MKLLKTFLLTAVFCVAWFGTTSSVDAVTAIKLGSLAPIGSPWDTALKKINSEWTKISGGEVILKVYAGGITGDEVDMIRKMRLGQLDAAGLTGVGISFIDLGVMSLQAPLLIRTEDELDYILAKMQPTFDASLEKKGYKVLFWTKIGWAHFFSKHPIITPDDMRKSKLFVYESHPDETGVWKGLGFNPVALNPNDLMMALQSGMVDTFTTSPLSAASYQWFGLAKNMCGMQWAPFVGAMVVSLKTWNKIPVDMQKKLLDSARKIGTQMQVDIKKSEAEAMTIMVQNGLKVYPVPASVIPQWSALVEDGFVIKLADKMFDKAVYNRIKIMLTEYRANRK